MKCNSHEQKLQFDSRIMSSDTLQVLATVGDSDPNAKYNVRMQQAYQNMEKELNELARGSDIAVNDFARYLQDFVKILRVEVPEDTDLNHYFEIMNNRGEQLEKHEVLKAELLNHLSNDLESTNTFSAIWDACSVMERYMVFGFKKEVRDSLFLSGKNLWEKVPENFEDVKNSLIAQRKKEKEKEMDSISLLDIIDGIEIPVSPEENTEDEMRTRFNSVINFPNFLLHALSIYLINGKKSCLGDREEQYVPLDDKKLIATFKQHLDNAADKPGFTKGFAYALLKTRLLFDNYVIKSGFSQDGEKWSLQSIKLSETSSYYKNTFEDKLKNRQALMLLAMFHVSFPQLIYKYWLSGVLYFLYKSKEVSSDSYIAYLEKLSKDFYFGRFGEAVKPYQDIIFRNAMAGVNEGIDEENLHQGTKVHNFIFNRLDYLIWKSDVIEKKETFNIEKVDAFEFAFRSSIEHYYPQHPKPGAVLPDITPALSNSFGNLCLISRNKNSGLSNNSPEEKAKYYAQSSAIESLKQRLMMKQSRSWNAAAIIEHQRK